MDLFNAMIPVKSEPPQELQDLFRLFFFEDVYKRQPLQGTGIIC